MDDRSIYPGKTKLAVALIFILAVLLMIASEFSPRSLPEFAYDHVGAILFVSVAMIGTYLQYFRSPAILLSKDKFTIHRNFGEQTYGWETVDKIGLHYRPLGKLFGVGEVRITLKPDLVRADKISALFRTRFARIAGTELSDQDLLELVTRYHEHWQRNRGKAGKAPSVRG